MIWTLCVEGWTPTPLNKLLGHWAAAGRLKAKDREVIGTACKVYGVTQAVQQKRRVDLHLILPKGQRACDPDAYAKSLLDGLVHADALYNDSLWWVEFRQPTFSRGDRLTSFVTIQDV